MKNSAFKVIVFVVSLFFLGYICYQVYLALFPGLETQAAVYHTVEDTIEANALVVRKEFALPKPKEGVVAYLKKNGEKVSKNGVVAEIYDNEDQAGTQQRINEIDEEISRLEGVGSSDTSFSPHPDLLNKQIYLSMNNLTAIVAQGRFKELNEAKQDFLELINRYHIVTGKAKSFDSRINQLKEERKALAEAVKAKPAQVKAPVSGYFMYNTSGFGNTVNKDNVLKLNLSRLNEAMKAPVVENTGSVGAIVEDFEWYLVCHISADDVRRLSVGRNLRISLPYVITEEIPAQVAAINKEADGSAVLVLRCTYMLPEISTVHTCQVHIKVATITGLYVDIRAVRYNDEGVKGVYIIYGNEARFKPIVTLYSDKRFVICSTEDKNNALKLYDEVIIGGKNLYDRKIIKR